MAETQQVEVYNPQGKLGTIPSAQLKQAKAAGYKSKSDFMEAVHPKTGQTGIIPKEQWDAAQKQGYVLSPREQQRAKAKAGAVIKPDEGNSLAVAMQGTGAPGITVTKPEDVAGVRGGKQKTWGGDCGHCRRRTSSWPRDGRSGESVRTDDHVRNGSNGNLRTNWGRGYSGGGEIRA